MPRIIPSELNSTLRREYRLRFFSILFFALSIVLLINILLVSSSYVLLSLYEKAYVSDKTDTKAEEITRLNESFNTKIIQVSALVQKIPVKNNSADIQIADLLFDYANNGISISSIEIIPEESVVHITMRGTATTRDSLIQFQNNINSNASFTDFSIPIESLTKQKDLSFDVNFIYHEN